MDKGGLATTVNLFKDYKSDLKNVFQSLKLLSSLVKKYPSRFEEFVFAGIPEKII